MARKPLIGTMPCPECGFEAAEVRESKGGLAYRWCPECAVQVFTRDAGQDRRMRQKMTPASIPQPEAPPVVTEPPPVPAPVLSPPVARRVNLLIE